MMRFARTTLLLSIVTILTIGAVRAEPTVLITGSNRGIGLELARQYADLGYKVIATARTPDKADDLKELAANNPNMIIEQLDVTDHAAIDALAEKYKGQAIDILFNNAGISGASEGGQDFGKIDYAAFDNVMRVNALGPLKMAEAFVDHVAASEQKKIMSVTSYMSSITRTFGGAYFYRSSKSALNMMMASLAKDLGPRGIIVGLVNPGTTATGLTQNMTGRPLRDPKDAAADMIRNVDAYTLETGGVIIQYDGSVIPW